MSSMYKDIVVINGQSISDIAIQEYGTYEAVFAIMVDNMLRLNSINDVLGPGTILKIRKVNPFDSIVIGKQVTNSNPLNILSGDYVASGYVASGYTVGSSGVVSVDKRGISEFQLELINI
jgi:hypothetical protein